MVNRFSATPNGQLELAFNSLECLGAYFTSQIHDLNNQIAVLSNAELLQPNEPHSPAMTEFLEGLFGAIHRLSTTCSQFNEARKIYPVSTESVDLQTALRAICAAATAISGWSVQALPMPNCRVLLNVSWVPMVIGQLIRQMQVEGGTVAISLGELPPRQYRYSLRSHFAEGPAQALLIHFTGRAPLQAEQTDQEKMNFQLALELVRLMGAGISLSRSDLKSDCLLALRVVI